jgi:hypothetical protein
VLSAKNVKIFVARTTPNSGYIDGTVSIVGPLETRT